VIQFAAGRPMTRHDSNRDTLGNVRGEDVISRSPQSRGCRARRWPMSASSRRFWSNVLAGVGEHSFADVSYRT